MPVILVRPCRVLGALLAGILGAAAADGPASGPAASLAEFQAAHRARAALAAERAAWRQERERLEAVCAALQAEVERLRRETADLDVATRALGSASSAALPASDATAARLAALTEQLADLQRRALPGVINPPIPAPGATPAEQLRAVANAIAQAERAAAQIAVAVVLATPADGAAPRAVRLLRIGSGAWWLSLDGHSAGVATSDGAGGVRLLTPVADEARQRIAQALAIAEGRAPATLLALPAPEPRP